MPQQVKALLDDNGQMVAHIDEKEHLIHIYDYDGKAQADQHTVLNYDCFEELIKMYNAVRNP